MYMYICYLFLWLFFVIRNSWNPHKHVTVTIMSSLDDVLRRSRVLGQRFCKRLSFC